jgi:two-component system response regulator RpaA
MSEIKGRQRVARKVAAGRAVLTTGEVALFLSVAPRTVVKWFDSGKLRGYRIPGSQDRRIPREQFMRFCNDNGIPVPPCFAPGVLTCGLPPGVGPEAGEAVADLNEAAFRAGEGLVGEVWAGAAAGRSACLHFGRLVRSSGRPVRLVYAPGDDEASRAELEAAGWEVLP